MADSASPVASDPVGSQVPRVRWTVVALLFAATTVNYIDRQVLGILAPTLTRELGWRETDYAAIVSWFSVAYGVGLLGMGRVMDRIGVRLGLSLAVGVWSLAAMAHALVRSVAGFGVARALLGIGESGNFPAAVKTVAEWFPKRERALADRKSTRLNSSHMSSSYAVFCSKKKSHARLGHGRPPPARDRPRAPA